MSAEVVIAAVKTVVTILTDKKLRNFVFGVILGSIIVVCIPVFTILAIFDGAKDLDYDQVSQMVIQQLDDEQRAKLEQIHSIMLSIESAMTDAGYSGTRISEAQVLFVMALYDHSYDSDFIENLVACFSPDQTDTQLITAVNATFNTSISITEFSEIMRPIRAIYIDSSGFIMPEVKNNLDLVQWVKNAAQRHWGYVWGT